MKTNHWNNIFKQEGKVYFKPQEDMPELVKLFKKKGIKKILDLGCGSGRHVVFLSKNGFDVYGIDAAPAGLKMTKDWLKEENLKANLKLASIFEKLPYKDNFFDAIVAVQAGGHNRIGKIRKLIKELNRVLKPKGLLFMAFTQISSITDWRVGSVQKRIFWADDQVTLLKEDYKVLGPRTFTPTAGIEKDLVSYAFDEESIKKEYKIFKFLRLSLDSKKRRYVLLAESKKSK